jgi:hypothetical protein
MDTKVSEKFSAANLRTEELIIGNLTAILQVHE